MAAGNSSDFDEAVLDIFTSFQHGDTGCWGAQNLFSFWILPISRIEKDLRPGTGADIKQAVAASKNSQ
jgi:hypothetical protein